MTEYWVHNLSPIIFKIGPLPIRWYGLMYILGFIAAYFILRWRYKKGFLKLKSKEAIQDMLFYSFIGALIGGRLGACFFYEPIYYLTHFWEVIAVWQGGMSSHGGIIGAMAGLYIYSKKVKLPLIYLLDSLAIAVTPGLCFGRIGNLINGELWGKITDVSWAVIFPAVDMQPRHPVQIYQAICEGIIPFLILFYVGRKKHSIGLISGLFAVIYSILRIFTERFREKSDVLESLGLLNMTNGQFYSVLFLIFGIGLLIYSLQNKKTV